MVAKKLKSRREFGGVRVSNKMHPFFPLVASFPASFLSSPMFAVLPPYLTELKSVLIPAPTYCESSFCTHCGITMLRTEYPMSYYDDTCYCSDECESIASDVQIQQEAEMETWEEAWEDAEDAEDAEMDAYIDSVLDNDYDW